jgi:hypothetical protein
MGVFKDITGRRYGRLTAIECVGRKPRPNGSSVAIWRCECDCGSVVDYQMASLNSGRAISCGCANRDHSLGSMSEPTMRSYNAMMARCHNPKSAGYKTYGGAGITVCDRWRFGEDGKTGFRCFIEDMRPRPCADFTLDRIDPAKGYSPDNCRWADKWTQAANQTTTQWFSYQGRSVTLAQVAMETGISKMTLRYRLRQGISLEEAAKKPKRRGVRVDGQPRRRPAT